MDAENNEINEIGNELNYYRYAKLLTEVCTRIMMMVYKNFYSWPYSFPHQLADHLDKIPANQQKPLLNLLIKGEIIKVKDMRLDEKKLRGYDITFYFKLIQFATNSRLLKPFNDDVWNNNCPEGRKGELEHLLFLIKLDRNHFNHKDDKVLNLKDEDIESFCDILCERILSIIEQTGKKLEKYLEFIDKNSDKFRNEIESIRVMKEISSTNESQLMKIMIQKDLMPKLQELRRCFAKELKSYSQPYFEIENGSSISTEELLSNINFQLICISAEAGHGKTSFTKFVQHRLLSEIEKAPDDDLRSQEIPIRIACRNVTGRNVSEFLEDEIRFSRHYSSSTSSLKICMEHFPILWIIDGYDERTAEFNGFFESLLKTVPDNHKIIVTSRPNSLKELKDKLREKEVRDKLKEKEVSEKWKEKEVCEKLQVKKVYQVSIKCFDDKQIREVAKDNLGEDKVADFESAIETLNNETLKFVKIPINLSVCLEFWSSDPTIFNEKLKSIYQFYDKMLEKHRNLLVSRLKGMTNDSEEDVKNGVTLWFKYLCEVVAESTFTYDLSISKAQETKLMMKAKSYSLIGTYCLSTFFNTDKSSVETNYFIRHITQKEVLSCVYLKQCDDDALKAVAQQPGKHDLVHLKFLMECCNRCEFARIFVQLLAIYSELQRPDCFLQIKDENENYCDALKTQLKASGQSLVLREYNDSEVYDLQKVLGYLMSDLNSFKLIIGKDITMYKMINDFISKYKDCKSFVLKLKLNKPYKFIHVIQMFIEEGNQHLIKELDLNFMHEWTEEMKKQLFQLESLNFVSFYVDCKDYSSSMLDHFATEEIGSKEVGDQLDSIMTHPSSLSPDVHLPQTAFTTTNPVPLQTPSSTSLAAFNHSCHSHFDIRNIKDSSKVFEDIVKVNSKFPSMSVYLHFTSSSRDLPDNLLRRFLLSSVQVKRLEIYLDDSSKFPNVMKLVNCGHIETLTMWSRNEDESSSVSEFESFFALCEFDKINKIKLIELWINAKSPLKLIYNKLPSDLLNKTKLIVYLFKSRAEMEILVDAKQFKRIEIWKKSKYLSASEIEQLKRISKSFIEW